MGNNIPGGAKSGLTSVLKSFEPLVINPTRDPIITGINILIIKLFQFIFFIISPVKYMKK